MNSVSITATYIGDLHFSSETSASLNLPFFLDYSAAPAIKWKNEQMLVRLKDSIQGSFLRIRIIFGIMNTDGVQRSHRIYNSGEKQSALRFLLRKINDSHLDSKRATSLASS